MPSNFKIATLVRNAGCDAMVDRIDAGTGVGTCAIRTGAPPTNVSDASIGTLLGTPAFGATAFGNASVGVATANPITSDINAADSGAAGHFRTYQGAAADTAAEWQGTAGETADTPDMVFDNKTVVQGGTIAITAMTFNVPIQ
jgi:hypothetical protein